MYALIDTEDGGRMYGFSEVQVSTNNARFDVVETTEDNLVEIFEQAKTGGETLDGADESIDAAIDDPLAFRDFLILGSNDALGFDAEYLRETAAGSP